MRLPLLIACAKWWWLKYCPFAASDLEVKVAIFLIWARHTLNDVASACLKTIMQLRLYLVSI